jgi:hypothetical protein
VETRAGSKAQPRDWVEEKEAGNSEPELKKEDFSRSEKIGKKGNAVRFARRAIGF